MARREAKGASRVRCAIYTRKSTEEGLDQAFNSLDAQREACEAYILSQRGEGWTLVPTAYDDGGVSGGTLERAGLRRLLADIAAGLQRLLADFARLVDSFNAAGASFVSVTRPFNTSTSMGRLTLNMLLSFAQFEREVTAQRIRDTSRARAIGSSVSEKAASKRKGMWMGGPVPLGYDAVDRALVPNVTEAATMRLIFRRYLALGSVRELKAALDRAGIVSKRRVDRHGQQTGSRPFSRGGLIVILRNPLYVGEVRHDGERHPGLHEAIVGREVWEAVQQKLDAGAVARRAATGATAPSLLSGLLFDAAGEPLTPSHASKGPARIRYRYYVSNRLMMGRAANHPDAWRLPAEPVEAAARATLVGLLETPATLQALLPTEGTANEQRQLRDRLAAEARALATLPAADLRALLQVLEARVIIEAERMRLEVSAAALARHLGTESPSSADQPLQHARPLILRKRGVETRLVLGGIEGGAPDPALLSLLVEARSCLRCIRDGDVHSLRELARRLGREHRHVARILPLAYLAPDITEAIVEGRQPVELTPTRLRRLDPELLSWDQLREALGFDVPG